MNKRGQYYLIAAMIIVIILASFLSVINYSSNKKDNSINEIQRELNIEIEKILEYAAYADLSDAESLTVFDNMSSNYIDKFPEKTLIFVYGNPESTIKTKGYNSREEIIYFNPGSEFKILKSGVGEFNQTYSLSEKNATIRIEDFDYSFEFQKGQGFYYLISNKDGGENNLIRG